MIPMRRLLIPIATFSILLLPGQGRADEAHSWCVTGQPKQLGASPDSTVNQIVQHVCEQSRFASCCDSSKGHWTLTCIQNGAEWAMNQPGMGDICGRFAWSSGGFGGTDQVYPRDFSLVALAGAATGFRHVAGGVMARGNVSPATGFAVNGGSKGLPLAIYSGGSVAMQYGTVYGDVEYVSSYSANGVSYANGGAAHKVGPYIDFNVLTQSLQNMANNVKAYPSTPASRSGQTVSFQPTSLDSELNVFSVTAEQIKGATLFNFGVPDGSAAIINVSGQEDVSFQAAGFSSRLPPRTKILWNLPDATSVHISSMTFEGSLLAPKARATMQYGAFNGSAVVSETANADLEWHWYPYQGAVCGKGCLCWDETWSCSENTFIDDSGYVVFPNAEAGFLEIAGGEYLAQGVNRLSPKHRIWYSFHPAASRPEDKPLAVFFNGGPGSATSSTLFAFNTVAYTLDPDITPSLTINQYPWTADANLLFIDAPATGFSYALPADGSNVQPDVGIDIDRDAGTFLRVVTRFLLRHPKLLPRRVILVGESYGGIRATLMLNHLFKYQQLQPGSGAAYQDGQLLDDLTAYFLATLSTATPSTAQIATKFNYQALIEPVLVGDEQYMSPDPASLVGCKPTIVAPCRGYNDPITLNCWESCLGSDDQLYGATCDGYNCNKDWGWALGKIGQAAERLTTYAILRTILGTDPKTIEWMKASSRANAYRAIPGRDSQYTRDVEMTATFGELEPGDRYFMTVNNSVYDGYGCNPEANQNGGYVCTSTPARGWRESGIETGTQFLENLAFGVQTFITKTTHDAVVFSGVIATALNHPTDFPAISKVVYSSTAANGIPQRPGAMNVSFSDGSRKSVPMPTYDAGHSITQQATAANQLRSDIF